MCRFYIGFNDLELIFIFHKILKLMIGYVTIRHLFLSEEVIPFQSGLYYFSRVFYLDI